MKDCPLGAIVSTNELRWIAGAAQLAAEYVQSIIAAETPHRKFQTAKDRRLLKSRRESLNGYNRLAREAARLLKKKRVAARTGHD